MARASQKPGLIDPAQAQEIINVLGALIEAIGKDTAAAVVLQQARTEIASLAASEQMSHRPPKSRAA